MCLKFCEPMSRNGVVSHTTDLKMTYIKGRVR